LRLLNEQRGRVHETWGIDWAEVELAAGAAVEVQQNGEVTLPGRKFLPAIANIASLTTAGRV
jgi:hypothetical protein